MASGISATALFVGQLTYLLEEPTFECSFSDGFYDPAICTRENICAGDSRIRSWRA